MTTLLRRAGLNRCAVSGARAQQWNASARYGESAKAGGPLVAVAPATGNNRRLAQRTTAGEKGVAERMKGRLVRGPRHQQRDGSADTPGGCHTPSYESLYLCVKPLSGFGAW